MEIFRHTAKTKNGESKIITLCSGSLDALWIADKVNEKGLTENGRPVAGIWPTKVEITHPAAPDPEWAEHDETQLATNWIIAYLNGSEHFRTEYGELDISVCDELKKIKESSFLSQTVKTKYGEYPKYNISRTDWSCAAELRLATDTFLAYDNDGNGIGILVDPDTHEILVDNEALYVDYVTSALESPDTTVYYEKDDAVSQFAKSYDLDVKAYIAPAPCGLELFSPISLNNFTAREAKSMSIYDLAKDTIQKRAEQDYIVINAQDEVYDVMTRDCLRYGIDPGEIIDRLNAKIRRGEFDLNHISIVTDPGSGELEVWAMSTLDIDRTLEEAIEDAKMLHDPTAKSDEPEL